MKQEKTYQLIKKALISEKSTNLAQFQQTYAFIVLVSSTKSDIKQAFEQIFSVNVISVRTVLLKGKVKRYRGRLGKRSNRKKAYVKLAQGQTIDFANLDKAS